MIEFQGQLRSPASTRGSVISGYRAVSSSKNPSRAGSPTGPSEVRSTSVTSSYFSKAAWYRTFWGTDQTMRSKLKASPPLSVPDAELGADGVEGTHDGERVG